MPVAALHRMLFYRTTCQNCICNFTDNVGQHNHCDLLSDDICQISYKILTGCPIQLHAKKRCHQPKDAHHRQQRSIMAVKLFVTQVSRRFIGGITIRSDSSEHSLFLIFCCEHKYSLQLTIRERQSLTKSLPMNTLCLYHPSKFSECSYHFVLIFLSRVLCWKHHIRTSDLFYN